MVVTIFDTKLLGSDYLCILYQDKYYISGLVVTMTINATITKSFLTDISKYLPKQ